MGGCNRLNCGLYFSPSLIIASHSISVGGTDPLEKVINIAHINPQFLIQKRHDKYLDWQMFIRKTKGVCVCVCVWVGGCGCACGCVCVCVCVCGIEATRS